MFRTLSYTHNLEFQKCHRDIFLIRRTHLEEGYKGYMLLLPWVDSTASSTSSILFDTSLVLHVKEAVVRRFFAK